MIGSKDKSIISVSHLREIFKEMEKYDITKLTINRSGESYEIQRGKNLEETVVKTVSEKKAKTVAQTEKKPEKIERKEEKKEEDNIAEIKTPIVGTFYRAPSPDSEPYVDIGSKVKNGDTLCVVEAMKTMNEIEAEINGTIEEILVDNGKMVEYDQTLFKIKVS